MIPDLLRFRLRFVVFLVRMWLAYDFEYAIFPFPVSLKRLAAPLFVFIFGMSSILSFHCGKTRPLIVVVLFDSPHGLFYGIVVPESNESALYGKANGLSCSKRLPES